jgi:hypothetical protein
MPVHPLKSEQKLGEHARLLEAREGTATWRQWGPYLSERQWGSDEEEFLSPFGIRSLSRFHRDHPFRFQVGERTYFVGYHPAESESDSFGGNSNWRGRVDADEPTDHTRASQSVPLLR